AHPGVTDTTSSTWMPRARYASTWRRSRARYCSSYTPGAGSATCQLTPSRTQPTRSAEAWVSPSTVWLIARLTPVSAACAAHGRANASAIARVTNLTHMSGRVPVRRTYDAVWRTTVGASPYRCQSHGDCSDASLGTPASCPPAQP